MKNNFEAQEVVNQTQVVSGGRLDRPRAAGETEDYVILVPEAGELRNAAEFTRLRDVFLKL